MANDPSANPQRLMSSCLLWVMLAFLAGLAITIAVWFFVARAEPDAAPGGEGPIEAAEPPPSLD